MNRDRHRSAVSVVGLGTALVGLVLFGIAGSFAAGVIGTPGSSSANVAASTSAWLNHWDTVFGVLGAVLLVLGLIIDRIGGR